MAIDPIMALKAEHRDLLLMLHVLERLCDRLEAKEPASVEHVIRVLDFLKVYGERLHCVKEEELFWPALDRAGIARADRLESLRIEHEMGRTCLRGMRDSWCRRRAGDGGAVPAFVGYAREYAALLRQHVDAEEDRLFRDAEERLSGEALRRIGRDFDAFEERRNGEARRAAFKAFLELMGTMYLLQPAGRT